MILWRKNKIYNSISLFLMSVFIFHFLSYTTKCNIKAEEKEQIVEGAAECVMELNSRRILYESNGETRLPIASTTKILTALTVLNNCDNIDTKISIPQEAEGVEGSSVYLKSGDTYSIRDLLYGMMLRSGNDCATALALFCGQSIANFSNMMNLEAQKAGALNSNFVNPHGLPCDEHYSTARDMCYINCYAMQNPIYQAITATTYYQPYGWKNKNKMLTMYEGANGGKTGYTKAAGRCLVSSAHRENMTLVCTVLNCATTYERSIKLLDEAFSAYKYTKILNAGQVFTIKKNGLQFKTYAKQDFYYPLLNEERDLIEIKINPLQNITKKTKKDEIIGQFEIYLVKQLLFSGNLYKL